MKTQDCSSNIHVAPQFCRQLKEIIARTKERLREKYAELFPFSSGNVEQALDEAEELAWATPFPHLFLPDFAEVRVTALATRSELAVAA
jgi:hypothetical protein